MELDIHKLLAILPHRYPFVMVDRVLEVIPNEVIRAYKNVSYNEPYFSGHFPDEPIMPGVLILESMAQVGGILAYVSEPFDAQSSHMYFLGIDKVKFRRPVRPGDRLDLEVIILGHHSNVWKLRGEATVNGALCAQGQLLASIVEHKQ